MKPAPTGKKPTSDKRPGLMSGDVMAFTEKNVSELTVMSQESGKRGEDARRELERRSRLGTKSYFR